MGPFHFFVLITVFNDEDETSGVAGIVGFQDKEQRDAFLCDFVETDTDGVHDVIGECVNTMDAPIPEGLLNITPDKPMHSLTPCEVVTYMLSRAEAMANKEACSTSWLRV